MAPYHTSSFESYANPSSAGKITNQEDVIFSLTERLRESESEIRHLSHDKSELENQLILRGNPIKLDVAYEELLAHLKERDQEFRSESKKQEERQRDLERENRKLKDKVHASRKMLDEQEHNLSLVERETDDELNRMRQRLDAVMAEDKEKDRRIIMLEDMVEGLTIDAEEKQKEEIEDKELLARLGERVENYRHKQGELERMNEELQIRVETQRHLLKEKEDELMHMERFRVQREDELNDDLDRMRLRMNEMVDSQRAVVRALDDREEEIQLLYQQMDRYEDIIDEAEYVTHEQRSVLHDNKREIKELSMAIDRVQNGGLLGQLDNMCSSKRDSFRA